MSTVIVAGTPREIEDRLQAVIDQATGDPRFVRRQVSDDIRAASLALALAGLALDGEDYRTASRCIGEAAAFVKLAQDAATNECGRREQLGAGMA